MSVAVCIKLESSDSQTRAGDHWTKSTMLRNYMSPKDISDFADSMGTTSAQEVGDGTTWIVEDFPTVRSQLADLYKEGGSKEDYGRMFPPIPADYEDSLMEISIIY